MSIIKRMWHTSFAASAALAFTSASLANPKITTVASAITYNFTLAAGASSSPLPVPANVGVRLTGVTTTTSFRGVGEASLLHIPGNFIEWVGLESTPGAAITQGFSGAAGTHIVFIDFGHQVDVEVAGPDQIKITNTSTGPRTGSITLVW